MHVNGFHMMGFNNCPFCFYNSSTDEKNLSPEVSPLVLAARSKNK